MAPAKVLVTPFGIGKKTSAANAKITKMEFKNWLLPLHSINSFVKSAIDDSSNDRGNMIEVKTIMIKPRSFKRVYIFISSQILYVCPIVKNLSQDFCEC